MNLPPIFHDPAFWGIILVVGAIARDITLGIMRKQAKRMREDKDPKNDGAADALDSAADALEKAKLSIK